jgi:hypothetical protein
VLVDLRAGSAQIILVTSRHSDEAGQANLAMPRGQLGFPTHRGLLGLALPGGLGLAESAA